MPEISVIVPVYKVEKYLSRCVDSILAQTFKDFELILVDDGSPDNCPKICDDYAKKDKRVVVIHKENGGLSDARNYGLDWAAKNSASKWVTFIDSDDWVDKEYLSELYRYSQSEKSEITICAFKRTDGADDLAINKSSPRKYTPEDFWVEERTNVIVAWGKLYKRALWENLRFPVGKINEDEFTVYKLLFEQKTILFIPEQLYFYYINDESITRNTWSPKRLDSIEAFERQNAFFSANKYNKALEKNVICLLYDLSYHMKAIERLFPKYKNYYKRLLRKQKSYFRKYRRRIEIPYSRIYEARLNEKVRDARLIVKLKYIHYYRKEKGIAATIKRFI